MTGKKVSLQVQDPETGEWKDLPSKEVAGNEFDAAREALNKRIIQKLIENDQTDNRFDTSDH